MKKQIKQTDYFEMTFRTEKEKIRAVCHSPEKRKIPLQFKNEGESCIISNLLESNKKDFKLTNNSKMKPKNKYYKYLPAKTIINKFQQLYILMLLGK